MNGPNVNLKFMQELVANRKFFFVELLGILKLNTYPLHAIHGAFCTTMKDTG